jgi:hypothetical protein
MASENRPGIIIVDAKCPDLKHKLLRSGQFPLIFKDARIRDCKPDEGEIRRAIADLSFCGAIHILAYAFPEGHRHNIDFDKIVGELENVSVHKFLFP